MRIDHQQDNIVANGSVLISGANPVWRNKLINGSPRLWQRGTSFTASGLTADRYRLVIGSGAAVTVSRQSHSLGQTDVPGNPRYYLRFNRTTTGSVASSIEQRIEFVDTLAGRTVVASGYIQGSTSAFSVTVKAVQNFGTGGSPSAEVSTTLGTINLTTGWASFSLSAALPSVSGKTLGTNNNDYLSLVFELGTAAGVVHFNLDRLQLEEGSTATPFEDRDFGTELAQAQRFYNKTFPLETTPAQNAGSAGSIYASWGTSTGHVMWYWSFPVRMRAAPTLTTYSPYNSSSDFHTGSIAGAVSSTSTFQHGANAFHSSSAFGTESAPQLHATADAEL